MIQRIRRTGETIDHTPWLRVVIRGCSELLVACLVGMGASRAEVLASEEPSHPPAVESAAGQKPDFTFSAPRAFVGLRLGMNFPRAGSDLYEMVTRELTLAKSDFRSWAVGVEVGARLHERVDLVFSVDYSRRTMPSEMRAYLDENDQPITQTTRLAQAPITGGVKLLLTSRGRRVSRYAWVPTRWVPYVGGGGGVIWYRFVQRGEFVDTKDLSIFSAHLHSSGWAPTGYACGGVEVNVRRAAYVVVDVRYSWANSDLTRDFRGFKPIDLAGLRTTAGWYWRF